MPHENNTETCIFMRNKITENRTVADDLASSTGAHHVLFSARMGITVICFFGFYACVFITKRNSRRLMSSISPKFEVVRLISVIPNFAKLNISKI